MLERCLTADTLREGTERQRQAYAALEELGIWHALAAYTPTLTGTIPLDIDIVTSDLDVICEAHDLDGFERDVTTTYGMQPEFALRRKVIDEIPSVIVSFEHPAFPVEIFAQNRPVMRQNAYRHMRVEARLLRLGGESARHDIRQLKQSGLKTEPAFAAYFGLQGDPYQLLLHLDDLSDAELLSYIRGTTV